MNKLIAAVCFMFALSPLAYAQDKAKMDDKKAVPAAEKKAVPAAEKPKKEPTEKQKAQQERMKDCNAKAKAGDKKGDERKKYMSSCLKGEDADASPKQKVQQNKMKSCNKDAGDKKMKGDERKKFMSECLKG
ncbi:MAG: PsiF family protein [Burkholderiales bacterium]